MTTKERDLNICELKNMILVHYGRLYGFRVVKYGV
jgi:hypothetical protein